MTTKVTDNDVSPTGEGTQEPSENYPRSTESIDEALFKIRTTHEVEHNDNQWTTEFVYSLDEAKQAITDLIKQSQLDLLERVSEEVIGEDSTHRPDVEAHINSKDYRYRCCERTQASNKLKSMQREALKRIKEGIDGQDIHK